MYCFYLENELGQKEIKRLLCSFFQITIDEIEYLSFDEKQSVRITFEINLFKGDFKMELSIYTDKDIEVKNDVRDLIFFFAKKLGQKILTSSDDINPYLWHLYMPNGDIYIVSEKVTDIDDCILIDLQNKKKI